MTPERMRTFSKHDQMLFVGSEFERARVWQHNDQEKFHGALARAEELLLLIMGDPKWSADLPMLKGLQSEVKRFASGIAKENIAILYRAL